MRLLTPKVLRQQLLQSGSNGEEKEEKKAKTKQDQINCSEKRRLHWSGADRNVVFFLLWSAPRDDDGSLMCDASALSLPTTYFFWLFHIPLSFVCVVIYFILVSRLSICIRHRCSKVQGLGNTKLYAFLFVSKASRSCSNKAQLWL